MPSKNEWNTTDGIYLSFIYQNMYSMVYLAHQISSNISSNINFIILE